MWLMFLRISFFSRAKQEKLTQYGWIYGNLWGWIFVTKEMRIQEHWKVPYFLIIPAELRRRYRHDDKKNDNLFSSNFLLFTLRYYGVSYNTALYYSNVPHTAPIYFHYSILQSFIQSLCNSASCSVLSCTNIPA